MSSEKNRTWRRGKYVWRGRIYISPETMYAIEKKAKTDDRDVTYLISKILEKEYAEGTEKSNE